MTTKLQPKLDADQEHQIRAVAEVPLDGVAPAVANAVYAATGVQVPAPADAGARVEGVEGTSVTRQEPLTSTAIPNGTV